MRRAPLALLGGLRLGPGPAAGAEAPAAAEDAAENAGEGEADGKTNDALATLLKDARVLWAVYSGYMYFGTMLLRTFGQMFALSIQFTM